MKNFSILPATPNAVTELLGKPMTMTTRSFLVYDGDRAIAMIGLYKERTRLLLFSYIKPDVQNNMKPYKRAVIMAYRKVMEVAKAQNLPVVSWADDRVDGSDRLLEHMGFDKLYGRVYEWHG